MEFFPGRDRYCGRNSTCMEISRLITVSPPWMSNSGSGAASAAIIMEVERSEKCPGLRFAVFGCEGQSFVLGRATGFVGRPREHAGDGICPGVHHGRNEASGFLDGRLVAHRDLRGVARDARGLRAPPGLALHRGELRPDGHGCGLEALDHRFRLERGNDRLGRVLPRVPRPRNRGRRWPRCSAPALRRGLAL